MIRTAVEIRDIIGRPIKEDEKFELDVLKGLTSSNKYLPSKYFYDAKGSELFKQITDLPEYYLTNSEYEILEKHKEQIKTHLSWKNFNFVEFGAGDGRKTKILLEYFLHQRLNFEYFPLDISKSALEEMLYNFQKTFPDLKATGLSGEYFQGLKELSRLNGLPNLILFLGSNIGNFNHSEAQQFLISLWESLAPGDLVLIGFDLVKEVDVLVKAYFDRKGVTTEFNLNLLDRINKELGGNFDRNKFSHYAYYDPVEQAMKSYLLSQEKQSVFIERLNKQILFEYMEPIFMENSCKYGLEKISQMVHTCNFKIVEVFTDRKDYFVDVLLKK